MPIVDVQPKAEEIEKQRKTIEEYKDNPLIAEPFMKDFSLRFCWSSNALEGNTLSLDETISVIEYDEVRSGHTFSEYQEAKNMYRAITEMLLPFQKRRITEEWIREVNSLIMGEPQNYRTGSVYIGTLVEAVYYPPEASKVPELMKQFVETEWPEAGGVGDVIAQIAERHIRFERIHPFLDGNGRTGRMILNQQLINAGLLPIVIEPKGKYRQAFRQYDKNGDASLMENILCKGELEAVRRVKSLLLKLEERNCQKNVKI